MLSIDLNCDMGEGFGPWKMGNDAELLRLVSSANIACGFHAGDPTTMRKTAELAMKNGVAIGAHPGYPDLQGFGRRAMTMTADEVYDLVVYQAAALKGICESLGTRLNHVKPHGALYNKAARNALLAETIARAVHDLDPDLILYGLSGSESIKAAKAAGLPTASEVFADRTYQCDGSLTPRTHQNALIDDPGVAADQAAGFVENSSVLSADGSKVDVTADTICIHGDGPHALEFAKAIRAELERRDIIIAPIDVRYDGCR
ncbi:MAG TPA: 5-oxoprolinase subunit PxpA [Pyrinomonadaceae bacterium]|nr:5-oxoprolinase subunit PxpA [Pyrinomonadaceae bacterium]